ncbi:MAG: choice-of-anchor D domain-containing protein, partial [Verrucomicrobiota bacterium]
MIGVTGTTNLGSVAVGSSSAAQTFNITNNNGASGLALNLTGSPKVAVSGANSGDFVVTTQPASPVAGNGGSQSFTVTFTPSGAGGRTAALSIASDDTTQNPIVINLTGTGLVPVIEVDQPPGTALTNGDTASFGAIAVNSTTSLTFAIKNTGLANLNLTGTPKVAVSGAHAAEYTVTAQPTSPVTPGGAINFTVQFAPLARGTRNATLSIANNDATNAPFTLSLTGAAVAPEIAIEQPPGTNINDNGTRNFGSVVVGATSKLTFIIKNTGDNSLTGLVTTINGTHAADFAVTAAPVPPVGGGGSTTFTVEFTPSAGGARTAAIHITNNDPDGNESPFDINLTGTGSAPAAGSDGFGYHLATTPLNGVTLLPTDADVITATNLVGDDYSQAINLGFTFYFYDKAYTTCAASTNGLLCLGGSSTSWSPTGIPSTNTPNNFIAPFWADLVKGSGSSILYATRGSAPNRVFILQYQDMEEYGNAAGKASFQVWLYEGSNSIEFQFKSISGFTTTRTVSSGIENSAGTVGIQYFSTTAGALPAFPDAVMITRPVVVGVESKYLRPNGVDSVDCGTAATGLNPEISTIKAPYGSVRRFEAPQYIYLDQFFAEIPATTPPANAWYRLVNDGYAIDGQVVQGTHTFFTTTLTHDVTVIWRWVLEYAVVITSATGDGGFGNPAPGVGRFWYAKNSQFTAAIDTAVQNDAAGIRIKNTGYTVTSYGDGGVPTTVSHTLNSTDARAVTVPLTITTPLQIQWLSSGQVRYRFSASSGLPGQSNTPFDGQAFVKVYDPTGATSTTTYSSSTYTDVWINTDADKRQEVVVGAFYRTADRCFTLVDFPVPPGGDLQGSGSDLSLLTDTAVPDNSPSPVTRVARTHTFNAAVLANRTVPTPTDIRWVYQPTVFRAEVPLGTAFDPAATVPALCGTNPVMDDAGPDAGFLLPVGDVPTGRVAGNPLRWDQVDHKLYPVHPGTRQIKWRDKNLPGQTYLIEIVSGYPGAVVNLTSEKENADGSRQGTAPAYVMQTTLQTVAQSNPGVGFPAQYLTGVASPTRDEDAHYHHLFDPVAGRRPPTELDISTADPWKFQELTYADLATDATVSATAPGVPFSAQGAGRSVVLYSYRPNPDEVADGNLTKEKLAVRVIRSSPINPLLPDNPKLVLGRRGLELGGGTAAGGAFGIITAGAPLSVNPGRNFVIDFWLNAKDLHDIPLKLTNCTTSATLPGTTVTCDSTANLVKGMSLSGANIAPGTRVASITNATSFVLSAPATAAGTALSLTASNKPVTVLSTAGDKLKVTLDAGGSTVTAGYLGLTVTQPLSKAGAAWRHYAIHVFSDRFFGVDLTLLDFYLDGVREEQGV